MEKKKHKHKKAGSHGAISVFLTIILVPCIVFTCVFSDLSRVQLSMAASLSAADLSLYSLMARYDPDLKEFYGLIGSCQNVESFYDATATYFEGMLKAEGVSGEGSKLFLDYMQDLKKEGTSDFLRTDIVTPIKVETAQDGAMGENPALIEDGIVEFMKYRGPIQITTNLIDRFSELNFDETSSEVDDNKQVVEKKKEYAKKQGDLLEAAFYTYLAILEYDKVQTDVHIPSREKYNELSTKLDNIRDDLKGATSLVAKYYYPGTENIRSIIFPSFSASEHHYDKEDIGEEVVQDDGTVLYCINKEKLDELLENLTEDLKEISDAGDDFVSKCSDIPAPAKGNNEVVYCMKMQEAIDGCGVVGTISSKGDDILKRYAKLQAAAECSPFPEGDDLPSDWEKQISDACDDIDEIYDDYLNSNGNSDYWTKVGQYTTTSVETVPKVQGRTYTFTSKMLNANATLDEFTTAIKGYLPDYTNTLRAQRAALDTAIDGGKLNVNGKTETVLPLTELLDKAKKFVKAREDWGNTSGSYDTEYANSEHELYQSAQSQAGDDTSTAATATDDEAAGERIAAKITEDTVTELKERLENIRSDITECLDAVDKFTYGGEQVETVNNGDRLVELARTVVPVNENYQISAVKEAEQGYFSSLISPVDDHVFTPQTPNNAKNGNNPDLNSEPPTLYEFLKNQLGDKNIEDEISKNKDRTKGYEKQASDAGEKAKGVDGELVANKGQSLTGGHADNAVNLLSGIGSIVSIANNIINGRGDELRDQLYVCEYIMDMFSYSDSDNEGKYRLLLKGVDSEDGQTGKGNNNVSYRDWPYSDATTLWETEATDEVMRNQSLTNRPINKTNNFSNLGEVEYILYGKDNIDENLKASYGNIFVVREAMNLVSGFCNFYSGTNATAGTIESLSAAVAAATAGIVPIPVTKCVLIGVLATLESSKDMERLKKGARVELYKSDPKQWVCSLEGVEEGAKDATFKEADGSGGESGMYYSDYMYIFLMIGLTNQKTYESMLLRVGDLIEANMKQTEGNADFDLNKTVCYFNLNGQLRVRPLMMALPIASTVEGADSLKETTDWCTYNISTTRGYS